MTGISARCTFQIAMALTLLECIWSCWSRVILEKFAGVSLRGRFVESVGGSGILNNVLILREFLARLN